MVFLNPLVWLLAAFQILSEINGQFSRSEFWDQFPDMWRGVASRSANSPVDVQRQVFVNSIEKAGEIQHERLAA